MRKPRGVVSNEVIAPNRSSHIDAGLAKTRRHGRGDGVVRRAQDARAPLEELNLRPERAEHRGDLHARIATTDDEHRGRYVVRLQGIAVRLGELEPWHGKAVGSRLPCR